MFVPVGQVLEELVGVEEDGVDSAELVEDTEDN
jgi:hypothetical protein